MRALIIASFVLFASCASHRKEGQMSPHSNAVQALRQLVGKDHFAGEPGTLYTGVHDPAARARLNAKFDRAIESLISAASRGAKTSEYLSIIDAQIKGFDRDSLDTEDAERVAANFELAMDCIGIKSSGGILNKWMYGFDAP
jgi:hypothetical protein